MSVQYYIILLLGHIKHPNIIVVNIPYEVWYIVYEGYVRHTMYAILCTPHCVRRKVYVEHYMTYIVRSSLSVRWIVYDVHCTTYYVRRTTYNVCSCMYQLVHVRMYQHGRICRKLYLGVYEVCPLYVVHCSLNSYV